MINNFQLLKFHILDIADQITFKFTDPRRVANQVLKTLTNEVKSCENAYLDIQTQWDILALNVQEDLKEEATWKGRITTALLNNNEKLANQAAIEAIRFRKLIDRYVAQMEKLEPLKNILFEEVQSRKEERDNLESEIELLKVEYSIAKSRNQISKLLNGVGTDISISERLKSFKGQIKILEAQSTARSKVSKQLTSSSVQEEFKVLEDKTQYNTDSLIQEARNQLKLIKN